MKRSALLTKAGKGSIFRTSIWMAILLATGPAHAETASTLRATDLQALAQSDAATVAKLPENTKVEILRRSGAWSEVKTSTGQTGWVRMLGLRLDPGTTTSATPAASSKGQSNPLGALGNLLSSGRTSNTGTVTTGVRGLSEEDLQNAQANPAELEKMQKFAVDKNAAQSFASRTKLTPTKVDYLSDPGSASTQSRNNESRREGN